MLIRYLQLCVVLHTQGGSVGVGGMGGSGSRFVVVHFLINLLEWLKKNLLAHFFVAYLIRV